ncbi:MAG: GNAT family N-acetyltransferase [Pseudomonadota bacterium]
MLTTDRLILRPPKPDDVDPCIDFIITDRAKFVGGGTDKTRADAWRAAAIVFGHWTIREWGLLVMELQDTGKAIGSIGPWYPEGWPEKELGWSIWSADHEGQGYAAEALTRTRQWAFEDLGWDTAVSYIDPENARSIALAERVGCTVDPSAAAPDDDPTIIYRHPRP